MDIKDIVFQAVSHLSEGVIITDALLDEPDHPMIVWANKAMERITGYTVAEIIGKTPRVLQGEKTNKQERKFLREELKKGHQFNSVIENYRKDGTTYWVDLLISPVFDQEGNVIYYIAIQRDVSHEKEMEQIIDEQLAQLKEANKVLGKLSSR